MCDGGPTPHRQPLTVIDIPGTYDMVAKVRAHAADALKERLGPDYRSLIETMQLLLSEVVTNALLHSRSGRTDESGRTGSVHIGIFEIADLIRIEVTDDGGKNTPQARRADGTSEQGRGLYLVEALASRWGAHRTHQQSEDPTSPVIGTVVWFELKIKQDP